MGRARARLIGAILVWMGTGVARSEALAEHAPFVIADFNTQELNAASTKAAGGSVGVWRVGEPDVCQQGFVSDDALGSRRGRSLRLTYTVIPRPHVNGWYTFLSPDESLGIDLSGYDRLGFFAKGTTSFVLEVKDDTSRDDGSPGGVAEYVVTGLEGTWTRVEIPFFLFEPKDHRTVIDWSGIRQLVVVFSDTRSDQEGWVMLDHLYAAKGTPVF